MQIGVVFPQTEIGADPGAVRAFAQAVESMGLSHVAAFDHVLGANPVNRPGFKTLYTHESLFHEPLTLFAYLAGVTTTLQFATCIMVLPQRQTALVAKQAAEVDVLSGGRLRLGVGVGWNAVEYEGLGQDFSTRGARCGEQIQLLRELWTMPCVTFEGRWDTVRDAGINPLPVQRPIPIWLGGMADAVIERVGTLADGWFPRFPSMRQRADADILPRQAASPGAIVERMRHIARSAGRDPASIGIEGRVFIPGRTPEQWRTELEEWRQLGATHMQLYTMDAGLDVDGHIEACRRFCMEVTDV